jgi:hypothetical protein
VGKRGRRQAAAGERGIVFPPVAGHRSTSHFGQVVISAALRPVDEIGATSVEHEAAWRTNYPLHLRRVTEASLISSTAAEAISQAGINAYQLHWLGADGAEHLLCELSGEGDSTLITETFKGEARRSHELTLPIGQRMVSGSALDELLREWVVAGVLEPSVVNSIATVAAHPEWLSLPGKTLIALGAHAELAPTQQLLRWGATVAAVDLPHPPIWDQLLDAAKYTGGTLLFPTHSGMTAPPTRAGLNLLTDLPAACQWLAKLPGELVIGNYLYADGEANVRANAAADWLGQELLKTRPELIRAGLATPTDVFAVPGDAVDQSVARYQGRALAAKATGRALGGLSRGRLLQPGYRPGVDPGICDALVLQQGPNYVLGKRLARWRAIQERAAQRRTSMLVAPPTRTRSVIKNRALAAAYSGAHRFGVQVFEPQTTAALMAALLVHDLYADQPTFEHPWQAEAFQAVHGGLWRTAYSPRSALGLAALLGLTRPR